MNPQRTWTGTIVVVMSSLLLLIGAVANVPAAAQPMVGDQAPEFTLPSTNGVDISLSDFRGKKWVFLEFYAAAFVPT